MQWENFVELKVKVEEKEGNIVVGSVMCDFFSENWIKPMYGGNHCREIGIRVHLFEGITVLIWCTFLQCYSRIIAAKPT